MLYGIIAIVAGIGIVSLNYVCNSLRERIERLEKALARRDWPTTPEDAARRVG